MSRHALMLLTAASFSCVRPSPSVNQRTCRPSDYSLGIGDSVSRLQGTFELTLIATTGDSTPNQTTGRLVLTSTQRTDAALVGETDIALETVGAARVGELATSADTAPGVAAFDRSTTRPSFMLRLGSGANALSDIRRIEGPFTVMEVHTMGNGGFTGSWRSSGFREPAGGYFCAVRMEPESD